MLSTYTLESGDSEASNYGKLHERDAVKKLENILGLEIKEPKKFIDKGDHKAKTWYRLYTVQGNISNDWK